MAGKKLFVGRLPFDFTDDQLRELFAREGKVVAATMVPDPKHGRSRGFGFVTMSSDAETEAVTRKLNGSRIGEKEIWVTEAKEKPAKAPEPDKPSRFDDRPPPPGRDFPRGARPSWGPRGDAPPRRPNRFGPRSQERYTSSFSPKPPRFGDRPAERPRRGFSGPRPSRPGERPAGGFNSSRPPRSGERPGGGFSSSRNSRPGERPSSGFSSPRPNRFGDRPFGDRKFSRPGGRPPSRPGGRPPPRSGGRGPSRPGGSRPPRRDPR